MRNFLPKEVSAIYLVVRKAILKSPGTYLAFALLVGSVLLTTIVAQTQQDLRQRAQTVTTFQPVQVSIVDFQFSPGTVTVPVGTTVIWTNRSTGGVPHTSTSDAQGTSNSWNSGTLNPGQSFTKTFTTVGTFAYHCEVHGAAVMSGRIIVTSVTPTATLTPTKTPTKTPTPTITPTKDPSVTITATAVPSIPRGGEGDEEPPYVCLGSCPTKTPTPTMTVYPVQPTNTPYKPTPTATPTIKYQPTPTATPTVTPTKTPYPQPTATLAPCQYDNSTSIASDNGYSDNGKGKGKNKKSNESQNIFAKFFEFFINIFFKLLEILFGFRNAPVPVPQPAPVPTAIILPSNAAVPTLIQGTPQATYPPAPTTHDTPMYRVYDPNNPNPSYGPAPTATTKPNPYATITPTPPCITPVYSPTNTPKYEPTSYAPTTTPTYAPSYAPTAAAPTLTSYISPTTFVSPTSYVSPTLAPSLAAASPTPFGRSVASIVYVPGNEPLKTYEITASVVGNKWLFNGMSPGPELRATVGDHLKINVHNQLPESLAVHWHGLKLPSSQDGVPGVTQDAIKPGNSLTYDYVVPDPGTYWYHSHQNTSEQVPKGLFGTLVVEPKQETTHYDREYYVVYRNTDPITQHFDANPGEKVHVRILNSRVGDFAGTPVRLVPIGVPYKVIAMDGQDLNGPQEIDSASKLIEIGFAQRYDIAFTMPASGSAMIADGENLQTVQFGSGVTTIPDGLGSLPVFDWTAYGTPGPDTYLPRFNVDQEETLVIGPNLSINGKLGLEIPDMVMKGNTVVKIRYVNNSNMTHPMHLHGHFYSVIKKNDKPISGSPIHLDTILLHPGENADVIFYTDDPGVWMLHCHVVQHAAAGLSMITRYEDVYTPYGIPGAAGNKPE